MALMKDVQSDYLSFDEQASAPATPSSGINKIYFKTDGRMYYKDDARVE
jgi:hypothetical protein